MKRSSRYLCGVAGLAVASFGAISLSTASDAVFAPVARVSIESVGNMELGYAPGPARSVTLARFVDSAMSEDSEDAIEEDDLALSAPLYEEPDLVEPSVQPEVTPDAGVAVSTEPVIEPEAETQVAAADGGAPERFSEQDFNAPVPVARPEVAAPQISAAAPRRVAARTEARPVRVANTERRRTLQAPLPLISGAFR